MNANHDPSFVLSISVMVQYVRGAFTVALLLFFLICLIPDGKGWLILSAPMFVLFLCIFPDRTLNCLPLG